jgi:glycosyltransferase involved in cell wall biosynthesis
MERLLFYSDSAEYGGHEALTVEAVQYLAAHKLEVSVVFAFYEGNEPLAKRLTEIKNASGNLDLCPLKFRSRSLQPLRSLFSPWQVNAIRAAMERARPDVVVVSQGRIESGTLGLLAAKRAGLRTITYIPMAHHISVCGRPFAAGFREMVNGYFYRLPDKIITISETARRMLLTRGIRSDVVVVPNGVEVRAGRSQERDGFRHNHGLRSEDFVIATIGRIDFRQKGQDIAVQTISRYRQELVGCKFLFIGSGPDERRLREMVADSQLQVMVRVLPWTDKTPEISSGRFPCSCRRDSRAFPGDVEAMSRKLPIVASKVDGMAEFLPEAGCFHTAIVRPWSRPCLK